MARGLRLPYPASEIDATRQVRNMQESQAGLEAHNN